MKRSNLLFAAISASVCILQPVSAAYAQVPLPISEESPGLLAQAPFTPAFARLTAFGEFPGAEMVAAKIRREGNRLVYVFDFKYDDHRSTEQVCIDAVTGQIESTEYSVERDNGDHFAITGPPELVSIVESGFSIARETVNETAENGQIVKCRLRVQHARQVFVFDVELGDDHVPRRILIDATTGSLITDLKPN